MSKKDWNRHVTCCENNRCPMFREHGTHQQLNFNTVVLADAIFSCPSCDFHVGLETTPFSGEIRKSPIQWGRNGIRAVRGLQSFVVSMLLGGFFSWLSEQFTLPLRSIDPWAREMRTYLGSREATELGQLFEWFTYGLGAIGILSLAIFTIAFGRALFGAIDRSFEASR